MNNNCCEIINDSRIKVIDPGQSQQAIILNLAREIFYKIRVDGCLIKNELAADWAIKKPLENDCETLIIELKGTDIEHALKQISATVQHIKNYDAKCKKFGALIVCNRMPKYDSKIRKGQEYLYKKYKAPLKIVSRNTEHNFDVLMGN